MEYRADPLWNKARVYLFNSLIFTLASYTHCKKNYRPHVVLHHNRCSINPFPMQVFHLANSKLTLISIPLPWRHVRCARAPTRAVSNVKRWQAKTSVTECDRVYIYSCCGWYIQWLFDCKVDCYSDCQRHLKVGTYLLIYQQRSASFLNLDMYIF